MVRIKSPRDFGAAIIFGCFGLAGVWGSLTYDTGTAARMGPGYMPMLVGWGLLGFTVILLLRSLTLEGPAIAKMRPWPVLIIIAAILLFGMSINTLGMAPATFLTCFVAAFAIREASLKQAFVLSVALAAFCVLIFIYALNQPLVAFRSF